MDTPGQFALPTPPVDGISSISFSPNSHILLATSWDKSVRLYDINRKEMTSRSDFKMPLLSGSFLDSSSRCVVAALDGTLTLLEVSSAGAMASPIGKHDSAARCLKYVGDRNLLLSGSWDLTMRSWDPRTPGRPTHIAPLPGKVYSMDVSPSTNKVVVAMANRHVHIYDLRKLSSPEQTRSSSLRHQTRSVRCSPEGWGYVLSSVEGRVAVEFFDPSPDAQAKKYAFKCHRKTVDGVETAFPVNAIAFHPVHMTFATGGCDNLVNVWDAGRRKRVCAFRPFPTSIADLDFSSDGRFLAVASSYTWEMGEKEHPKDEIFIREIEDKDVTVKK